MDLLEQDIVSGSQWHQLGHMQICTLTQTYNHASIPPLSFLQAGWPSCCPTNSVKAQLINMNNKQMVGYLHCSCTLSCCCWQTQQQLLQFSYSAWY